MASGVSPTTGSGSGSGGHNAPASGGSQKDSPATGDSEKAKSSASNAGNKDTTSTGPTTPTTGPTGTTGTPGTTNARRVTAPAVPSPSPQGDHIALGSERAPTGLLPPAPPAPPGSPHSVGVAALAAARGDINHLNALPTPPSMYKGANTLNSPNPVKFIDPHFWNGDDQRSAATIAQANGYEDDANKQLLSIAGDNVRSEVYPGFELPPGVFQQAQTLGQSLTDRLRLDDHNAEAAVGVSNSQIPFGRMADTGYNLDEALTGVQPDALPLDQTPSFLSQAQSLHQKIGGDHAEFHHCGKLSTGVQRGCFQACKLTKRNSANCTSSRELKPATSSARPGSSSPRSGHCPPTILSRSHTRLGGRDLQKLEGSGPDGTLFGDSLILAKDLSPK